LFYYVVIGLTEILESPLNKCENDLSANTTYQQYFDVIFKEGRENWLMECPVPCNQTIYEIDLQQFHQNNNGAEGNKSLALIGKGVMFSLEYNKFVLEQHVENLIYDTGNFLAQAGRNLGHFLGFSCLSLLFDVIILFEIF